jgi:RNA polymerase primary sigma factor
MIDKIQFLETLRSLTEIAKVSEEPLSKEEILSHFDGMTLTKEQQEMVYQYLLTPVEEREKEDSNDNSTSVEGLSSENKEKNSVFLEMYLEDINELPRLTAEQEESAYIRLINGDNSVSQSISDHWLSTVVELAKKYESYDVNMEDLIQEGNIGLLGGLKQLIGSNQKIDVKEYLKESVLQAFENYIDEELNDDDMENSILSKITLINEAIKVFAEENGVIPTVMEIADYTKISEDEVANILRLSLDTVKEKE